MRVSSSLIAAVCLACAPALAAERCPIAEDMDGAGVAVAFADGSVVTYARRDDTVLEITRFDDPERDFWLESHLGVYPLADGSMRRGAPDRRYVVTSRYPVPLEELPAPEVGMIWSGDLKEIDSNGVELGASSLSVKVSGLRPITLGECAYPAMQVETLFTSPDGGYQATLDYIPDLGIGVQTAGGPLGALLDFYRPVAISPVAP